MSLNSVGNGVCIRNILEATSRTVSMSRGGVGRGDNILKCGNAPTSGTDIEIVISLCLSEASLKALGPKSHHRKLGSTVRQAASN